MSNIILKELRLDIDDQLYDINSGADIATTEQYAEGSSSLIVPSVLQVKEDVNAINLRINTTNAGLTDVTTDLADNYYDKTEIDAKVTSVYKFKGSLDNYAALEAIENPTEGDVYNIIDTGHNYAWVDAVGETPGFWDPLSSIVDLSGYSTTEQMHAALDLKQDTLVAGDNITIDPETNEISANAASVIATTEEFGAGTATDKATSVKQVKDALALKQDNLTAGSNITITNNSIDATLTNLLATDEEYAAGTITSKAPNVKQVEDSIKNRISFTVEDIPDSGGKKRGIISF